MFFSVRYPVKIGGKLYIPCVCYTLTRVLEATVDKLVAEGTAVTHKERVYFQNGVVLKPEKKAPKVQPVKAVKTTAKEKAEAEKK